MPPRSRPSRPVRFAAVTAAAFGLGVPAALALSSTPDRPKLDDAVVRPAAAGDDAPEVEAEHGVEVEHEDEATTTTTTAGDGTTTTTVEDRADDDAADDHGAAGDDDHRAVGDDDEAGEVEDVRGNCDEAEHADDADCADPAAPTTTTVTAVRDDDHSGPG